MPEDIIGKKLLDVKLILDDMNLSYEIVLTKPPREVHYINDDSRVLRVKKLADDILELVVCNIY